MSLLSLQLQPYKEICPELFSSIPWQVIFSPAASSSSSRVNSGEPQTEDYCELALKIGRLFDKLDREWYEKKGGAQATVADYIEKSPQVESLRKCLEGHTLCSEALDRLQRVAARILRETKIPSPARPLSPEIVEKQEGALPFEALSSKEQILEYALGLSENEAHTLLSHPSSAHPRIAYLIGYLPFHVLENFVILASGETIDHLNAYLKSLPWTETEWLNHEFVRIRQEFVDRRNSTNEAINELARDLRKKCRAEELSCQDAHSLALLRKTVEMQLLSVQNIQKVISQVVTASETVDVFAAAAHKYEKSLNRLKPDPQCVLGVQDNLYGIIFRNIFIDKGVHPADPPESIFAPWGLPGAQKWIEMGLVEGESPKTLEETQLMLRQVRRNLATMGVQQAIDWLKFDVFNSEMLKNFLSSHQARI